MQKYFRVGLSNYTEFSQLCEQATCLMTGFWFLAGVDLILSFASSRLSQRPTQPRTQHVPQRALPLNMKRLWPEAEVYPLKGTEFKNACT
jgi:hypothetical protein